MKRLTSLTIATLALLVSSPALAGNWVVNETVFGVTVSNDKTGESFKAVSKKAAEKQAKILNNIEDKKSDDDDK